MLYSLLSTVVLLNNHKRMQLPRSSSSSSSSSNHVETIVGHRTRHRHSAVVLLLVMIMLMIIMMTAGVASVRLLRMTRHIDEASFLRNSNNNNDNHLLLLNASVQRLQQAGYHVCRPPPPPQLHNNNSSNNLDSNNRALGHTAAAAAAAAIDDDDNAIPICSEFQQQQQQQFPLSSYVDDISNNNNNKKHAQLSRRNLQQQQQDETSSNSETETGKSSSSSSNTSSSSTSSSSSHNDDNNNTKNGDGNWFSIVVFQNFLAALVCVCMAAMAAGLTLGLLGLDPLVLLIKQRAAATSQEQRAAQTLLPVVQQHHRLLVTLLLLNAAANEALPIFLEALVSPTMAILLSVTLVLFFGEIIPSAIFTGPHQLKLASRLVPIVKIAMWIMYPIAGPIAYLMDILLHSDDDRDDSDGTTFYNRGELSALIRIQYEERLAAKRKRKKAQQEAANELLLLQQQRSDHTGALDFSYHHHHQSAAHRNKELRATKNQMEHAWNKQQQQQQQQLQLQNSNNNKTFSVDNAVVQRSPSIHMDEVLMAEGALQMQTKVAIDVFTSVHKLFSIPSDMILNERNLVKIYASGYTRIPVYEPPDKTAICGLLMTKQLIVVQAKDKRPVGTLPLRRPHCVSPETPLVHLINLLQTGGNALQGGGHMALVCARPYIGNKALQEGQAIPETAGLMGVITLEDVLEALLQEQIYDEMDKKEREATRLARMVCQQWKRYVRRKKAGQLRQQSREPAMVPVVEQVMESAAADATAKPKSTTTTTTTTSPEAVKTSEHNTDAAAATADERTPLVVKKKTPSPSKVVYSWFNHTPSRKKEPPRK